MLAPEVSLYDPPGPVRDLPRAQYLWPATTRTDFPPFAEEPRSKWSPSYPDFAYGLPPRAYTYPANVLVKAAPFPESPLSKWQPRYDDIVWDVRRTQFLWPDRFAPSPVPLPNPPKASSTARPDRGLPGSILPSAPRVGMDPAPFRATELPRWDAVRRQDLAPSFSFQISSFGTVVPTSDRWQPGTNQPLFDVQRRSHLAPSLALVKHVPFGETIFISWQGAAPDVVRAPSRLTDTRSSWLSEKPIPNLAAFPSAFQQDDSGAPVALAALFRAATGAFLSVVTTVTTADAFPDVAMPGASMPDWSLQGPTVDAAAAALNFPVVPPQFRAPDLRYVLDALSARLFDQGVEQTLVSKWFAPASEPVRDAVRQQAIYPAWTPLDAHAQLAGEHLFLNWWRPTEQPLFDRVRRPDVGTFVWYHPFPIPTTAVAGNGLLLLLGIGS